MKRFVVLSTQRSGSTFSGTCLASHSDVQAYGEIFQHLGAERLADPNPPVRYQVSYQSYLKESFIGRLTVRFWQKRLIYKYKNQTYSRFEDKEAVGFELVCN